MRTAAIGIPALLLAASVGLSGCDEVVTLNPVVPTSALVLDDRLEGQWYFVVNGDGDAVDSSPIYTIVLADSQYLVSYVEDGDSSRTYARVGRVGSQLVVDLTPADGCSGRSWLSYCPAPWPAVDTHALYLLEMEGDLFRLLSYDADSVRAAILQGRGRLPYVEVSGQHVVMGGTTDQIWRSLPRLLTSRLPVRQEMVFRRVPLP